jgi:DNA-binding NarL/FixJ family response regulator
MRVILADDSVIVRMGLERLLGHEGHEVVATLSRPEPLAAVVTAHKPDAVLIDIRMPPTHTDEGLRAASALRTRWPRLAVLLLSQYVVPEYALRLLEAGEQYTGYLLKDRIMDPPQLTQALERLVAGGTVVDPDLIASLFAARQKDTASQALSDRELEVLKHIAEGLSDKGIAERLVLSTHTIGTHIQHIFQKLGLPDSATANRRVLATLTYLQDQGGNS